MTRPKDNDGTEPICRFPTGYWCGTVTLVKHYYFVVLEALT
ncbi:hypothetical protein QP38_1932 [Levilactobacillus brevis]|nr:hypothetical protein QP38_1932 [Levilactobacillus brevis]